MSISNVIFLLTKNSTGRGTVYFIKTTNAHCADWFLRRESRNYVLFLDKFLNNTKNRIKNFYAGNRYDNPIYAPVEEDYDGEIIF